MGKEIVDVKLGEKEGEGERNNFQPEEFIEKNRYAIIIFVLGIIFLGAGILGFKIFNFTSNQPKVEILRESEEGSEIVVLGTENEIPEERKITVEVAGQVMKPGVYELKINSRINDLLTLSGGLSANADREYVAKNINLAMKLTDGAKIYIPSNNQILNSKSETRSSGNEILNSKININTATGSELDTLAGVGEVTAKKIIDGRPYLKIEDLLDKKIVNKSVWEKIKESIVAY